MIKLRSFNLMSKSSDILALRSEAAGAVILCSREKNGERIRCQENL